MSKIAKISEETHRDLQAIQTFIIDHGIKTLPLSLHPIVESLRDKPATYKTIIAIAVKFLRMSLEGVQKEES